jgi:hypothetical protein
MLFASEASVAMELLPVIIYIMIASPETQIILSGASMRVYSVQAKRLLKAFRPQGDATILDD